ncbi:hypothetical protein L1987_70955 [Smallanthus sonchifolius]|uniref:Uncharacterized protein n=1 Tax=Smallanthus sonchifolius TaxID=185202 RepID=A0ACB9AQR1_9ASTR|nr:hypothetical protein L1987_70955 [Smallanthus sonchifolius]
MEVQEIFGVWEDEDENQLVPMFLKTSDTMVDHDMEEVGMEDIFEESDIYACNDGNRLSVVEYAEDLYANYRRMEHLYSIPLVSSTPTIIFRIDVSHGAPGRSDVPSIALF